MGTTVCEQHVPFELAFGHASPVAQVLGSRDGADVGGPLPLEPVFVNQLASPSIRSG